MIFIASIHVPTFSTVTKHLIESGMLAFFKNRTNGLNGNLYTLYYIQNYILNRKQNVVPNGKMSDWAYPNVGVQQGSV